MRQKRGPHFADRWLHQIARNIASRVKPEKIILFGSHAYGRPHKDSDFDLLVILNRPRGRWERYEMVDKAIGEHLWPIDLLVRSPKEVEQRLRIGDSFFMDVFRKGKVLYES